MSEQTEVVSLRLNPQVVAQLREIADTRGCTVSDLLRNGAQTAVAEANAVRIIWTAPMHAAGPNLTVTAPTVHEHGTSRGDWQRTWHPASPGCDTCLRWTQEAGDRFGGFFGHFTSSPASVGADVNKNGEVAR